MSVRIALGESARAAAEGVVARLVEDRIASRITAQDESIWPDAVPGRLAWTEAVAGSVPLIAQTRDLQHTLRHDGIHRAVVPSPSGATLAAAMIARTTGGEIGTDLTALDGAAVVVGADDRDGALDAADALAAQGVDQHRLVLLTSAADAPTDLDGASVVRIDRTVLLGADGALGAAALVPAALAGADLHELLDEAESEALNLAIDDPANNGLLLGAVLATAPGGIAVAADGTHIVGFPVWAARLMAETPPGGIALDGDGEALDDGPDGADGQPALVVRLVEDAEARDAGDDVLLSGTLGELVLVWQYAVTVASVLASAQPS